MKEDKIETVTLGGLKLIAHESKFVLDVQRGRNEKLKVLGV